MNINKQRKFKFLFILVCTTYGTTAKAQESNTSQQIQNSSKNSLSKEQIIENIKQNISTLKTGTANPQDTQNNFHILLTTINSLETNFQQLQNYLNSSTYNQNRISPSVILPNETHKRNRKSSVKLPIAQPNAT